MQQSAYPQMRIKNDNCTKSCLHVTTEWSVNLTEIVVVISLFLFNWSKIVFVYSTSLILCVQNINNDEDSLKHSDILLMCSWRKFVIYQTIDQINYRLGQTNNETESFIINRVVKR